MIWGENPLLSETPWWLNKPQPPTPSNLTFGPFGGQASAWWCAQRWRTMRMRYMTWRYLRGQWFFNGWLVSLVSGFDTFMRVEEGDLQDEDSPHIPKNNKQPTTKISSHQTWFPTHLLCCASSQARDSTGNQVNQGLKRCLFVGVSRQWEAEECGS